MKGSDDELWGAFNRIAELEARLAAGLDWIAGVDVSTIDEYVLGDLEGVLRGETDDE